jgi:hypothetical protein
MDIVFAATAIIKIMPKYNTVFQSALKENMKVYLFIFTLKRLAVTTDNPCETITPAKRPIPSEKTPIKKVSEIRIRDILFFSIPSVIYIPNSLFRLRIRKLLAYTIRKPNMKDMKTEMVFITIVMVFMMDNTDSDICIIAF